MPKVVRGLGFFVGGFVVSWLVRTLLTSSPSRSLLDRIGHPELGTLDGAHQAGKEARRAVGFVKQLTQNTEAKTEAARPLAPRWVGIARDSAEMLLAAGGVLKTLADVVQQDEKLRRQLRW